MIVSGSTEDNRFQIWSTPLLDSDSPSSFQNILPTTHEGNNDTTVDVDGVVFGGHYYFFESHWDDAEHGLYRSDGTLEGTTFITSVRNHRRFVATSSDTINFISEGNLTAFDGTAGSIRTLLPNAWYYKRFILVKDYLFFAARPVPFDWISGGVKAAPGYEVFASDKTAGGAHGG